MPLSRSRLWGESCPFAAKGILANALRQAGMLPPTHTVLVFITKGRRVSSDAPPAWIEVITCFFPSMLSVCCVTQIVFMGNHSCIRGQTRLVLVFVLQGGAGLHLLMFN